MKKFLLSIVALATISTTSFAQTSPFEWQAGKNTKIKLGGFVRFNVNADVNGSVGGGNDFISTNIKDSQWDNEGNIGFDPSATRLSLQITQATKALGDVKVYVETDMRGSSVRLRQAYVDAKGVIAGHAWSFMADLAANAPTVDINGVGSRTFLRTNLVGYRCSLNETLSAGIALEMPTLASNYIPTFEAVNQQVPNIPIYIQAKGGAGHIKLGAMIRTMQYGISTDKERESQMGCGGQLSGSLKATDALTVYGQAIYGNGINNYISNVAGQNIALMSTDGKSMEATPMGGYSLGLGGKFSKGWSAAVSGSLVENYGDKDYFAGQFEKTSYVSAALFYAPARRVTIGAEYLHGTRQNFGADAIAAERFSIMFKYSL